MITDGHLLTVKNAAFAFVLLILQLSTTYYQISEHAAKNPIVRSDLLDFICEDAYVTFLIIYN